MYVYIYPGTEKKHPVCYRDQPALRRRSGSGGLLGRSAGHDFYLVPGNACVCSCIVVYIYIPVQKQTTGLLQGPASFEKEKRIGRSAGSSCGTRLLFSTRKRLYM